jgi:hypothetical protein
MFISLNQTNSVTVESVLGAESMRVSGTAADADGKASRMTYEGSSLNPNLRLRQIGSSTGGKERI